MVQVALVDFGNTLADETFMRRDCEQFPTWTTGYGEVVGRRAEAWNTGLLSTRQLAEEVAAHLGAACDDVHAYMLELCRSVAFYPAVNEAVRRRRARGGRQALVTVNPDLFDDIVDRYALREQFDLIVASWEHHTDDKVALCQRTLDLLGVSDPSDTVLIDNVDANVDGWMQLGGRGYVFRDDHTFVADVLAERVPGFVPADVAY